MSRCFKLLSEHFPKNGGSYGRDLDFGEYVDFMSGAAGASLKELATTALVRPQAREDELASARSELPEIANREPGTH